MITDEMLRRSAAISCDAFIRSVEACHREEHIFSPAFEKKIRKLYGRANHPYLYRLVRQVASFLLALLIGGCVWLAVDEEARAAFFGWVKEVYESAIGYHFVGDNVVVEKKEYHIPVLPEGYEEFYTKSIPEGKNMVYADTEGKILQFNYRVGVQLSSLLAGGDFAEFSMITINGKPAHALSSREQDIANSVVWEADGVLFEISGFFSVEELIWLAETVEEIQ